MLSLDRDHRKLHGNYLIFRGEQRRQTYGNFEGFLLHSALFGKVIYYPFWNQCKKSSIAVLHHGWFRFIQSLMFLPVVTPEKFGGVSCWYAFCLKREEAKGEYEVQSIFHKRLESDERCLEVCIIDVGSS